MYNMYREEFRLESCSCMIFSESGICAAAVAILLIELFLIVPLSQLTDFITLLLIT